MNSTRRAEASKVMRGRPLATNTPRYSPWVMKQLPTGKWVIDQADLTAGKIRRYGTYDTKAEAKEILTELRKP